MAPSQTLARKVKPDAFAQSPAVMGLQDTTFSDYLSEQNIALVMFYNPSCPECQRCKPHFVKAANTAKKEAGHIFAAVNCAEFPHVCKMENVFNRHLPAFLLYARGKKLSEVVNYMDYKELRKLVEECPFFPPNKPHTP
ncbi:protein disulfide-isomerase A5-like isoform X2 [Biomphalaria glabrata]|uniref:Protein disulfide-isomerase A5-like isoform X2 n=1 Tax=Biomphalaria glabrata TaxID=6526 RepID=A0A2C9KGP1_BIOGL|nr:protein disulfide-isomerase A5-like isoform X2 [Biomphalaria glabrata]KAI8741100.1 protein disulfide-isomerase A5-like isoform X2 [Biomphalaria glabrata]KAI8787734.1 protein disulfide-isomerase A5 isoform X2 [Biomphalaria glabrata]